MIGEASRLDMGQYNVVQLFTQDEFDDLMQKYMDEEGHYPDA